MRRLIRWWRDWWRPPDIVVEIANHEFTSPEEFMEWLKERQADNRSDRIRFVRRWERSLKRWTVASVAVVLMLLFFIVTSSTWPSALFQSFTAGFVIAIHTNSIRGFAESRARLIQDLEADPDAAGWWYDAYPKGEL